MNQDGSIRKLRGKFSRLVARPRSVSAVLEARNSDSLSLIDVLPGEKIRLVFIIRLAELWASIEPVWKSAARDNRFDASVVLLKSAEPEGALASLSRARALLESSSVPYFTEQSFSLNSYRPHVIFYPEPYSEVYPENFKPENVVALGCRVAYVPYGLEVGGGVLNARYQYDTEVPRLAWRVFARSPAQLASFTRHCVYGSGHVVITGHPRSEIEGSPEIRQHHIVKAKARTRQVILWTPHFTVLGRRKWSSFQDYYEIIPRLIDERPDLFLLLRPHPFLRERLSEHEDWGHERVNAWFNALDGKDNVHVDTESDYRPALEVSSALMSDAGSLLVEYLFTGKPICYLTGKGDIGLSEEAQSLGFHYPGTTEIDIGSFLDQVVLRGGDSLREARVSALEAYFGLGDNKPSHVILNEISHDVGNNSPRVYSKELPTSRLDDNAFRYWVSASSTFLAPEAYYQEQESQFRDILSRHARGEFAADIGCGNGRFSQILSEYFEFTEATDPSEQLINEAREQAIKKGISNLSFSIERIEHVQSLSSYDFVSCTGVTSGIIDDEKFIRVVWMLKAAMRPNSLLLMKDTLSVGLPQAIDWENYTAVYRNVSDYLEVFSKAGLEIVDQSVIEKDENEGRTNGFFLFKSK